MILDTGVTFALLSMLFAGINDVVFKRYSMRDRSRGMYVFGIGVVWAILQIIYLYLFDILLSFEYQTILYGLVAGILLVAANILLVEGLRHTDISFGSTVYRLNTIGVVILSFLFLRESVGIYKFAGIALGVMSVLLLYNTKRSISVSNGVRVFFWLIILASFCRAIYGVVSKVALTAAADKQAILLLAAFCWIVGGGLYARYVEKRFIVTRKKVTYSLISGLLVFFIVNLLILGLDNGQASIVVPIANMSFIVALLISVCVGYEKMDFRKSLAVVFAMCSVAVLSVLPS
jgi:drug/metabolite transporter (DMT)-like permease